MTDSVMEAYSSFAQVYDLFMEDVPYEQWAQFIKALLDKNNICDGLVLDLACGTGKMTRKLRDMGYDMIGVDMSCQMLDVARCADNVVDFASSKDESEASQILYLCQDMREFELYGTVRAVVCSCDSLNYLTDEEDIVKVFRLVNNYLDSNGLFIFDINSPYKYKEILADNCIAEDRESAAFIWDNCFDDESGINEYALSLFIRQPDGRYDRSFELHYERCYELDEIKRLLNEAGLDFVAAYGDYEDREPVAEDERIVIVAREKYHEGKTYI